MNRIIAHLDMDAFFAAIEERDRPRLKGLPIVVGADPVAGHGRGVVSTANYAARAYGIHSAMSISRAWQLSQEAKDKKLPAAVFIGGNHKNYTEVSREIIAIVKNFVSAVEEASIDEAYFDLSFLNEFKKAEILCQKIKTKIKSQENLTCSIGIGPNKLIAKIASDAQKPDGLTIIGDDDEKICQQKVEKFLENLTIRKIPGIGPKTETILNKLGVAKVRDLQKFSEPEMKRILGKWGMVLYQKIRGKDDSPVGEFEEIKSIGEQETFSKDTLDAQFITQRMKQLIESVFNRFQESRFDSFKTIVITVRFSGFITKSKNHTLKEPIHSKENLEFEVLKLLLPFFDQRENPSKKKIRLIGVRIEKLESV